jgi:dihydrofolate reductase
MRRLTSIVAVNKQGVIGLGNALPWRIRSDLKFFRAQTTGNVVIMGRKTHDSLGKCLPGRHNIVVSHQLALFESTADCVLRYGIFDALAAAENAPKQFAEAFVIGGAMMYDQFADLVDRYLVTIVDKEVLRGDAFFDDQIIGNENDWEVSMLASGNGTAEGDEAPFQVFELTARNLSERRALRLAGIDAWNAKAKTGSQRRTHTRPIDTNRQHHMFALPV